MSGRFAIAAYVAGAVAFVLIANANWEALHEAMAILVVASLVCGWLGRWPYVALVSVILVPLAAPFGYPESRFAEPLPVSLAALFVTPISAALILLGGWIRQLWLRRRASHTPARQY